MATPPRSLAQPRGRLTRRRRVPECHLRSVGGVPALPAARAHPHGRRSSACSVFERRRGASQERLDSGVDPAPPQHPRPERGRGRARGRPPGAARHAEGGQRVSTGSRSFPFFGRCWALGAPPPRGACGACPRTKAVGGETRARPGLRPRHQSVAWTPPAGNVSRGRTSLTAPCSSGFTDTSAREKRTPRASRIRSRSGSRRASSCHQARRRGSE